MKFINFCVVFYNNVYEKLDKKYKIIWFEENFVKKN